MEPICAVLDASPSTYYAAKKREVGPSERARRDEWLKTEVLRVWKDSKKGRGLYGARKVWNELRREGIDVARCTVERLMGVLGIAGVSPARKAPRTTVPGGEPDRPGDQLGRDFTAAAPNRAWVADLTYVPTVPGWVYTALITDLFSRRIVGWQVAEHLRAELALDALEMAIWARSDGLDGHLVHHSDLGVQYTSIRYSQRLDEAGIARSVGSKGDSYDNAAAESVNSLYKKELINHEDPWEGVHDVTLATLEWVSWYNNDRLHSACGHIPPKEYEDNYYAQQEEPVILTTTG